MTPIDAMALAISSTITSIHGSPPDKEDAEEIARAALLALAECKLPPAVSKLGRATLMTYGNNTDTVFSAILRALASEGGENVRSNRHIQQSFQCETCGKVRIFKI